MTPVHADEFGRRHSEFVELQEDNRCALIYANRFNQIALVSESSFKSHISYELLVDFSLSMGYPVLGFSCTDQINFEGFNFEKNADISLIWYLSQRSIWIGGKEVKTDMPLCSSGTVIKIDTTNGQDISFQVTNLLGGKSKESVSLSLQDVPDEVFLFVGALRTGNKFISFQLSETKAVAESISADLRFTQVKEIHTTDVTREIHLADLKVFGSTNMHISSDGKVYTRTSTEQGNSCVVLPMMIKSGRHRWTLEVRCDFGASCCVGLARFPFKLSDDYMRDPLKHIYRHPGLLLYRSYRGLLYIDGRQLERTLQPIGWQHNSSVKIMIDVNMDDKTVEIFRNGKSLGIAFREIVGPLQPVICFYASYEKEIELVSYETSEMSYTHTPAQKHSPRTPSEQQLGPKEAYFDPMYKHGSISLSNNRKSISREKSQAGNAYCLMDVECAAIGVYRFSFVIETDQGASVCIGVTDASPASIRKVDIGNIYLSPSLYLYRSFQGMLYFKGRELTKRFDEFWMSGTLVEMTVDIASDEAVIQYTVNGKDQGIAFSGLKPPLRPLIAIYAGMEKKVTMIHFEHNVPKFATPPTLGTSSSVNDINATESFASRTSLPTVTTPRNAEQPSSRECMICGGPADTILLPCMHSTFCARDASRTSTCIICGQQVDGVWNILTGVNR